MLPKILCSDFKRPFISYLILQNVYFRELHSVAALSAKIKSCVGNFDKKILSYGVKTKIQH